MKALSLLLTCRPQGLLLRSLLSFDNATGAEALAEQPPKLCLAWGSNPYPRSGVGISSIALAAEPSSEDSFVSMSMYHADLRALIGYFLTGCASSIATITYITNKQVEGSAGKLQGDIAKLDERLTTLEKKLEANHLDVRKDLKDLTILVQKSTGRKWF